VQHPPDCASDAPFLPALRQGLILWLLFLVAHHLGGMFVGAIEGSCPGSTWAIALGAVLLVSVAEFVPPGESPLPADLATAPFLKAMLLAPLPRHPVSFGILGLSSLVAGTFLLLRTFRAAPGPSLTMGVP
jgi:hypothetical protein